MKLYEYLATGKPIVSVPLPYVDAVPDELYVASGGEGFVEILRSLADSETSHTYLRRKEVAKQHSWRGLVDSEIRAMCEILGEDRRVQTISPSRG